MSNQRFWRQQNVTQDLRPLQAKRATVRRGRGAGGCSAPRPALVGSQGLQARGDGTVRMAGMRSPCTPSEKGTPSKMVLVVSGLGCKASAQALKRCPLPSHAPLYEIQPRPIYMERQGDPKPAIPSRKRGRLHMRWGAYKGCRWLHPHSCPPANPDDRVLSGCRPPPITPSWSRRTPSALRGIACFLEGACAGSGAHRVTMVVVATALREELKHVQEM